MRRSLAVLLGAMMLLLAPVAADSRATANTWEGTWNTDFGPLILTASGSGTYYDGKGTVSGTIKGNVLEGTWTQPERRGKFKFTMSADGRSFTGVWNYEGETATAGWNGICAAGPCLKNGVPASPAKPTNTKTVAAPAPGGTRAVTSPKPLPTSRKVGVTITSSKCRGTASAAHRTPASSADCAPPKDSTVIGEGGLTPRGIGGAVANCWLIGPESLVPQTSALRKKLAEEKFIRFFQGLDARRALEWCMKFVKKVLLHSRDRIPSFAAPTSQGAAACSARRIALAGPIRNGRFTSLRLASGKLRPTDVRYRCTVSAGALNVTVDGRASGGLRKALGTKLDLGVVRSKDAEKDGGRLTFKFGW